MQTAVGKIEELGSSPTLCRLETRATRADVEALNRVPVEQFIAIVAHWEAQLEQQYAGTGVKQGWIGAAVVRNTRRIRILLASQHPLRNIYFIAANALASP